VIRYLKGDLFRSKARTLVNPVNCKGVMGKGLALEFRRRWPEMYHEYRRYCQTEDFRVGRPILLMGDVDRSILCFPTKDDWRDPSTYEIVEAGLKGLRENWGEHRGAEFQSMAFPALGCGLGGLEWPKVKPLFEKYLVNWPIDIEVYEPSES
jgi:O-acetyl-ADP-ribose deacetylase (regulator of RNase III)